MSRLGKILKIILIALACLLACVFIFRNKILQMAFARVQARMHDSYHTRLTAGAVELSGIDHVSVRDVCMQPEGADTLLRIGHTEVDISLVNLLRGKIVLDRIVIDSAVVDLYHLPDRDNLSMLRVKSKDSSATNKTVTFREKIEGYEAKMFRALNTAFELRNITLHYHDTTRTEALRIRSFTYDLHSLSGDIINLQNPDTISIAGTVIKKNADYQCTIEHHGNDSVYLPFADAENGLRCRFQRITASVKLDHTGDHFRISTDAAVTDFHIRHWRLATEDVVLPHARCRAALTFTDHGVELDSTSVVTLGSVDCRLAARYQFGADTLYALAIHMPEIAADSFFGALPAGMFHTLRGISCSGTLAYDLNFELHSSVPDSLIFTSALRAKGLRIQHFGAEDYARINAPFVYDAYDHGKLVRHIMIGESNPYFTPLGQMSHYLPQAVMQAEDPGFMQHRGFLTESFRESIAQNYKEHRFARGGSTISMQLVKNVFLSRDKTISRKAEEALIVYLIENLGLVPKERMLEVYLNAIEWGPDVYGIGEASRFYFDKKPATLTLPECLFLASIIPRPKSFRWQFDNDGELRASLGSYFNILATRMVWRGVLSPNDTIGLLPKVTLRGPAKAFFNTADSSATPPAATAEEEEEIPLAQPSERELKREERRLKREKRKEARRHKEEEE